MPYKLLFVCLGNICRSPSAENIMNHLIERERWGDRLLCDSAGTSDYHIGKSPDPRMTAAARERGIPFQGRARQFQRADFEKFDLILAMDRENYHDILLLDSRGKYRDKVKLMLEFASNAPTLEVPDPYYGGPKGFDLVIDLLLDACEGLSRHLIETGRLELPEPDGKGESSDRP